VEELRLVRDDVPGKVKEGGMDGLMERRIERHVDWHVHEHLKHVAAETREVFRSWPVARLMVGGNRELFEEFRRCLVAQLRDRWVRDLEIEADAPIEQVHEVVLTAEAERERELETERLRQLYDRVPAKRVERSGGYGVVGIPETLRALYMGEVQTLVVDADLQQPGFRCTSCGALWNAGDQCPICQSRNLQSRADLADEAIEDALAHGGEVDVVGGHAEFRQDGGLGGLLRFKPEQSRDLNQEA
jgi:peptide subunit release factor 1 (eRF1)